MRTLRLSMLCAAAIAVVVSGAPAAIAGDIQVLCEPGLRVYLDDELAGTSSAREDGLYLMGVRRGLHTVRVEKDGYLPQSFEVEVLRVPIEIEVGDFTPLPTPVAPPADVEEAAPVATEPEAPVQLVGSLVVTSAPQNCTVEIDGRREEKNEPQLAIGGLPAGEHTIRFSKDGFDPVSGTVTVRPGGEMTVRGNLVEGRVETVHTGKGSLRVISKPQRCSVRILGMLREKTGPKLNLSHLPAGEHLMVVSIPGRELETHVVIYDRTRTVVEVSFMAGDEPFTIRHVPH
jgi:hypothetical protein